MYEGQLVAKLSDVVQGDNPRTFFDEEALKSLAESIKVVGVIEPIVVRPMGDGRYKIIAGERRWRASKIAFGEDGVIPIVVRDCTEGEAEVVALAENHEREEMAPTEEAQQAHKILVRSGGNRQEAADRLGWPVTKLDKRLALMRLTAEVRQALNERKILLGHAELLAAVPQDKQNSTLEKIIQHSVPVAAVKAQLGKLTESLKDAAFDKSDCVSCEFNSECQSALFGEALDSGYCTNRTCYQAKTDAYLQTIASAIAEEVPRVEIIRAGGGIEGIKLTVEGRIGVGEAQAAACKGCANFGCTVSAIPGSVGEVERSICFDAACHATKVQANVVAAAKVKTAASVAAATTKAKGGTEQEAAAAATKAAKDTAAEAKKSVTTITSTKVKEYRLDQWRKIAAKVLYSKPDHCAAVLIALALSHKITNIDSQKVRDASKRVGCDLSTTSRVADAAACILSLKGEDMASVVNALAPSAMKKLDTNDIEALLELLNVNLADHWKLGADFLGLLTKSEIEFVVTEVGIAKVMGEKSLSKALNGKRDELIKAVLSVEGFEYQGAIPACMKFNSKSPVESAGDVDEEAGGSGEANEDAAEAIEA